MNLSGTTRLLIAVIVAAVLGMGAAGFYTMRPAAVQQTFIAAAPVAQVTPPPPVAPPAAPAPATAAVAPSFDIVRVGPQGNTVIAGRAAPGSDVVVFDGTVELGRSRADARGEFVVLPSAPLAAGGRELTLASRQGAGPAVPSEGSVVLVIPPAAQAVAPSAVTDPAPAPVAVLVPTAGPPRVLQGGPRAAQGPSLDVVDYDEAGGVRFSGGAQPGSTVRVYVDNAALGDAVADAGGRWGLAPTAAVAAGVHTLRADALDVTGRVLGRVELPFQRAATPDVVMAGGRVVVQPGQTLWRLARSVYGSGVRYTVIYMANRDHIRDPRLIYPGQAFAVPGRPLPAP